MEPVQSPGTGLIPWGTPRSRDTPPRNFEILSVADSRRGRPEEDLFVAGLDVDGDGYQGIFPLATYIWVSSTPRE